MGTILGDLDVIGLADLLQLLVQHQRVGALSVFDKESRKVIYFGNDGLMLLSTGQRKGPRLGEMLLLTKRLTFPQVARGLESQKQWGVHFGEAVVRLGYLPREAVNEAILEQVEEELCDLFFWTGAAFEFVEGPPPPIFQEPDQPVAVLKRDVSGLILEAMRRIDEWKQFNHVLGGGQTVFALTDQIQAKAAAYASDPVIGMVVQSINGQNTIDAVVEEAGVSRFQVFRILVVLLHDGCLQRISPEPAAGAAGKAAASDMPELELELAETAAAGGGKGDDEAGSAAAAFAREDEDEEDPDKPARKAGGTKRIAAPAKTGVTKRIAAKTVVKTKGATKVIRKGAAAPPTILIVSPMGRFRESLGDTLKKSGYRAVGTSQEGPAVEALKRYPVDVILLDAPLPPQGVHKAIGRLKQVTEAPILVMTPVRSEEGLQDLIQTGARECFHKPLDMKTLLAGLKRHAAGAK
jgi:CheY-like chemotaxis protein